ncbi:NB-ARC domains-containing protein [Artemisia annua]|uniref:ADP-ribosyl cyclase/cyclic ADP-ribose hydrolase n=1 Tax=Artemisia annua TaxID=35608 RepID=A0A2U1L5T2_ARTAN|nr:NB-ARC domains-containing protein [Artemisia annua]
MATTSILHRWKYDVFVSFRGDDIRKSFVDHLFNDFNQKGIYAFRDDTKLPKGEEISPHLYKAIEESRFLIVIFSKNYASSSWCLRELVKILQCKQMGKPKHEVQIIFYDVKPDVVRKQAGIYAEAFAKHDVSNRTEVDKWREALSMAANFSGWDLQDMTNGFESKFIDSISREILKKLSNVPLDVGENLVGLDIYLDKLDLSRFIRSDKVNMIGICGISGIGKTTLAKAIYNLMYVHFEGSCFCEDVKEVTKRQGIIQVQMHLINKILKAEDLKISCVGEGSTVIKQRMACKPILLVLDDVDHRDQLKALAGSTSWFCLGSLIIFTCKDKQLLRSHGVDEIHDMKFLDEDQSLQLFSFYAFKEKHPSMGFQGLADKAVKYVQGHPLALIVLGCFLYGKTMGQWVSELDRLKLHPNEEIQRVLRLSYDGLNLQQQNILLDITCLFIGENSEFVASILDGCNFFADTNMQVLVDKSLITIRSDMSLQMHDLIQAMAREIIHEESIMTGKQRRLWNSSEVYNVLSEKKVQMTEAIEVLVLLLHKSSQKVHIDAKAVAHMKKLRILKIYQEEKVSEQKLELKGHNVIFLGNLYYLSNELSLFCWHGCPFKYLPSDFYPENIVAIDLSYSRIKQLWTKPKCLTRLKIMKLRYCYNLTTTPDFSKITNLEELDLEGCVNMVTIHPSIGMLKRLVVLNMRDCRRAKSFHNNQLPQAFWSRWWTSIRGFIWNQQHPQRSVVSFEGLHMLKDLNLSYCNLEQVPDAIGGLSCLEKLNLEGNNFTTLPGSLSQLSSLKWLQVDCCKKLEVLPEFPHSLETIKAPGCTSLCSIMGSNPIMSKRSTYLSNCPKLFKNLAIDSQVLISETQCLDSSITSQGSIDRFSSFLRYACIQNNGCELFQLPMISWPRSNQKLDIIYHGNRIPNWFTNKSMGNHIKVELPLDWSSRMLMGYGVCVVFKRKKPSTYFGYTVNNFDGTILGACSPYSYSESYYREYFRDKPIIINESDMIWLHYTTSDTLRLKKAKNFVTFGFYENEAIEVKEMGVRLVFYEDLDQEAADVSMFQDLPTLSEHGGALCLTWDMSCIEWSW